MTDSVGGVLDHVVWHALNGPHAAFAERVGRAAAYPADVAGFAALPPDPTGQDWDDAAALLGPGRLAILTGDVPTPPPDWTVLMDLPGVQLVDAGVAAAPDAEAVRLGADDVPEVLDLVARTRPGPFLERTIELGTYLGVRRGGRLVAMAGERMHPTGATEISAVCTDPAHRGQGLAGRLVLAVAHGIRERGELPFLHASASNTGAIRLYEQLGLPAAPHDQLRGPAPARGHRGAADPPPATIKEVRPSTRPARRPAPKALR